MVAVGFPQKSTFGTLTANVLRCPEIDSVAGNLVLKRAGVAQFTAEAAYITANRSIRQGGGTHFLDSGGGTLIGGDGAGNIDDLAPITDALGVRTPRVNNPNGVLGLQYIGVDKLICRSADVLAVADLRLDTDKVIEDVSGATIIASDNAGHVDQLGRIDAVMTTPDNSHSVYANACELVSPSQSGTWQEEYGSWITAANDSLYLYISPMLERLALKGSVVIDDIKVYMWSGHVDGYITALTLIRNPLTTVGVVTVVTDPDDIGNGTTGYEQGVLTCDHTLLADNAYQLKVDAIHAGTGTGVYGIKIRYHLS